MNGVIYADVLVVLNIYVTYLLLSLTGYICRKKASSFFLLLSSAASGLYSLIILVPDITDTAVAVTKIPVALVLVGIGFGFNNKRQFLRIFFCFLAVSFGFAGVMLCLWLFFAPEGMYYNNGIVYFNIDTVTLVLLTVVCYGVLYLCNCFIRTRTPSDTVFDCEVLLKGRVYKCHCFLDTGNSLKDPYDGTDVIVMSRGFFGDLLPSELKPRLIPCSGVEGEGLLLSFKCDEIKIKGIKTHLSCKGVTIALKEGKIHGGSYDGILPYGLFLQSTNEKGADFENEHQSLTFKT